MVDGVDEEIVNDQLLLEGWRHLYDHVIRLYLDGIMMSYFEKRVCIHGDPSAKETTLKRSSVFQTYVYAKTIPWFVIYVIRGVRMKTCQNFAFFCKI